MLREWIKSLLKVYYLTVPGVRATREKLGHDHIPLLITKILNWNKGSPTKSSWNKVGPRAWKSLPLHSRVTASKKQLLSRLVKGTRGNAQNRPGQQVICLQLAAMQNSSLNNVCIALTQANEKPFWNQMSHLRMAWFSKLIINHSFLATRVSELL